MTATPWIEATSVGDLLARAAERWPDAEAIFPDERETYAALRARAETFARRLVAAGVGRGDHVGILLAPGLDFLGALFGTALAGATIVPVNDRFKARELGYLVRHADLRVLVTTDAVARFADFPALLTAAFPAVAEQDGLALRLDDAPELRALLLVDSAPAPGFADIAALDARAADVGADELDRRRAGVLLADPAFLMYTSGTSAEPKGCMLSHEMFTRQGRGIALTRYGLRPADVFWCPLPLFHNGGIATLLACLSAGASYCHAGHFEPGRALAQLQRERCTHALPTFETISTPMLEHPDFARTDLSALRVMLHAGSPERLRAVQERIPHAVLLSNYGSTEATGHFSMSRPDDPLDVRLHTCGHPLPGMEVRIVDPDTGVPCAPGVDGEIAFRGPMRFAGYYKAPELTAAAIDGDGWFRSGDRGRVDADGRVVFGGRLKDMLKVGGENVAAAEVEAHLLGHPAVAIATVVGAPDARYTEVPAAFVQLQAGAEATEEELIAFCVDQIATYKVPRYVRFVTEWPMSGTKIQKFRLRESIAAELTERGISAAPRVRS